MTSHPRSGWIRLLRRSAFAILASLWLLLACVYGLMLMQRFRIFR